MLVIRRVTISLIVWAALVSPWALAAAPKAPPSTQPPSIILITLDTTRADRMGFLGSNRRLTPNLDALAKQSTVFTRAYAQAALTPPSHATILTGAYPQFHQVNLMSDSLAKDLPYIPDILHAHGYQTAAFLASIILAPVPPYAVGFDRGFDTYDADFHEEGPGEDRYRTVQRRGAEVVNRALAWISKHPKGPFFIWVHLYDAHDPYDPPQPFKTRYASQPYDGGIAYEDAQVGRFLQQLKLRGLYDGAVIAVMADHGESLGAHGEDTHGVFLYDETIHVPLLIKLPRSQSAGKKIDNRVELVDVAPTLLQQAGAAIPPEMQGASLLSLMKPESGDRTNGWRDRPAYSQSEYPRTFGWSPLQSLRAQKYLYVQAPRRELYDQAADPLAERNIAPSSSAVADTLAGQLQALRQTTSNTREAPKGKLDLSAQEKLGALGYMATSGNASKTYGDRGLDPKDRIEVANMSHRAERLQEDGHSAESIALMEQVIAKDPTAAFYMKLGTWLMREQDFQRAAPAFRKSLELNPEENAARFMLGKCLLAMKDFQGVIPVLEALIAEVPDAVQAHSYLELAYARTNRPADAIKQCRIVLQYDPDDHGSYLILGQSLARTGDPEGGVAALKKAASMSPGDPTAHAWLADVYDGMGKPDDAARERAEADRLTKDLPR